MEFVPTLHIRNLPEPVYEKLKRRATVNRRSLNAEVLALLSAEFEHEQREGEITKRLRELAYKINLPPDAPRPEDILREERDSR